MEKLLPFNELLKEMKLDNKVISISINGNSYKNNRIQIPVFTSFFSFPRIEILRLKNCWLTHQREEKIVKQGENYTMAAKSRNKEEMRAIRRAYSPLLKSIKKNTSLRHFEYKNVFYSHPAARCYDDPSSSIDSNSDIENRKDWRSEEEDQKVFLGNILNGLKYHKGIESIDLSDNFLIDLFKEMKIIVKESKSITEVQLSPLWEGKQMQEMAKAISRNTKIRRVTEDSEVSTNEEILITLKQSGPLYLPFYNIIRSISLEEINLHQPRSFAYYGQYLEDQLEMLKGLMNNCPNLTVFPFEPELFAGLIPYIGRTSLKSIVIPLDLVLLDIHRFLGLNRQILHISLYFDCWEVDKDDYSGTFINSLINFPLTLKQLVNLQEMNLSFEGPIANVERTVIHMLILEFTKDIDYYKNLKTLTIRRNDIDGECAENLMNSVNKSGSIQIFKLNKEIHIRDKDDKRGK